MSAPRPSLRVVITGHVDHGKSTIIGRLLADAGGLPQGKLERIRAFCERHAKPFEYAFLLDALKDEQAQGITIEASRVFFKSALRDYVIVDAPGHVEFLKNMVSGAAGASAALIVVDANEGLRENSRRHGTILSLLGLKQIAVLINKMDLVGYREDAFRRVADEYGAFLKEIGVQAAHFVPVSGLHGDNLAARSARMPWYRGMPLLELLDSFALEPEPVDRPFRMPVQGVYKFGASGGPRVVAGMVLSGSVGVGDAVVFHPSGKSSVVRSIEEFPAAREARAQAGRSTGIALADEIYVRRGEVMVRRDEPPPQVARRFKTRLIWLGRSPLVPGKDYVLKAGTARVAARLESVLRVVDAATLREKPGASSVDPHEVADCVLRTAEPLPFDPADANPSCGRFVLVDEYEISGGGLVREPLPDPDAGWSARGWS